MLKKSRFLFLTLLFVPTLVLTGQAQNFLKHSAENPITIVVDANEEQTVLLAAEALSKDFERLSGTAARLVHHINESGTEAIIVGSLSSPLLQQLEKDDAYFQLVHYPVKAAGYLNQRILKMENGKA